MSTRTTNRTVSFTRPFLMSGIGGVCPAGTYVIETDEELLEPLSFVAYRRMSTSIQVPRQLGRTETYVIDPEALEAALAKDAAGE